MNKQKLPGYAFIICLIGPAFAQAPGQEPTKTADSLRQLTTEVRLLRQTFESYARNQARFEMLLQRTKIQQELVTSLSMRLDDARAELSSVRAGAPGLQDQIQNVENQLRQTSDQEQRTALEKTVKDLQATRLQQSARETELRDREAHLSDSVQTEQARLQSFNQSLDAVFFETTQHAGQ